MLAQIFILAATAAIVPAHAQDTSAGCTAKSFSIPSWFIQELKSSADGVSFHILNRATNYTADLACPANGSGWNACSVEGTSEGLTAAVQVSEGSATFAVNQTWTCNDRGKPLTFSAAGNHSAALGYTLPILVRGSLASPVAITPAYSDGPTGHDSAGCAARSEAPAWVLSTIWFTDDSGDGETTVPFQNFNLVVTNPANGYQASCMPAGSFGGPVDISRLVCAGYEFQSSRVGRFPIVTAAAFDPQTFVFSLNQTWFCDDTDAAKPLQITAAGSVALPLECTTERTEANQTHTNCNTAGDVTLRGTLGSVTTLPPYALEEPVPTRGDGCTLTSIFRPVWQFSHFAVDDGRVGFEVILQAENRGFQYPIPIYQGEPVAGDGNIPGGEGQVQGEGGEGWYECEIGADGGNGLPLWPYRCQFRYAAETRELVLAAQWACADLDEAHPVYFSGVTTTTVNSTLACETVDGRSRCATADPGYVWAAEIANVTWGSTA